MVTRPNVTIGGAEGYRSLRHLAERYAFLFIPCLFISRPDAALFRRAIISDWFPHLGPYCSGGGATNGRGALGSRI